MDNQDIFPPASLQSFPQLSQIPSQISDVLNGEKIIASFEVPNIIKYMGIFGFCIGIIIFGNLFVNGTITLMSSLEIIMISMGLLGAFGAAFVSILLFSRPVLCVVTQTRLFRLSRGSVEITKFEEIFPQGIRGISYGRYHIELTLKPKYINRTNQTLYKILLLMVPMSREIGQYISNQVDYIDSKNSQVK